MSATGVILQRHLRLFFRDRMAVYFGLLGALVLFVLYTLFLGGLQTADLEESFPAATSAEVRAFVDSWMIAGVVGMTAITTGLGAFGVLVDDLASKRFPDILVAPVRPGTLVLGSLLAALVIALSVTFAVLGIGLLYLWIVDGVVVPFASLARIVGILVVAAAAFCALSAFVTSFVSSPGTYAALCTITGTVLGFLTGSYIPLGSLPDAVAGLISAVPFGQASMLLRAEFAAEPLDRVVADDPDAREPLRTYYGLDAAVGGVAVTGPLVVTVLLGVGVVFTVLAALRLRLRVESAKRGDRLPRSPAVPPTQTASH